MKHSEFNFTSHKMRLFGQYWQPETVKAVVVLVHGFGEHSSRYADFVVPRLLKNGYAVVSYDNVGHGRSEGKRGHCPGYDALLDILQLLIDRAKGLYPGSPMFLYGHSMGGNLVINHTLRNKPDIKGAVASSPYLRLAFDPPKWKLVLGKLLLGIAPGITMPSGLDSNAISRDQAEVKKYNEDPLVHDKVSPMFSFPIMEAGEWAIENASGLQRPMLLIHGTADELIDHNGSKEFATNTPLADLVLFEGGYHELHNDLEREKALKTIIDWLDSKL